VTDAAIETVPGVTAVLAPEGATVSLSQCQQEPVHRKQQQLHHQKGFPVKKQRGYKRSLFCVVLNSVTMATFPTISDSKSRTLYHCDQRKIACFIHNTNSGVLPEKSVGACTHLCVAKEQFAF